MIFGVFSKIDFGDETLIIDSLKKVHKAMSASKAYKKKPEDVIYSHREKALDQQREFLTDLFEKPTTSDDLKKIIIKIILLAGNIRMSAEDYIIAANLIRTHDLSINVNYELEHLSTC